MAIPNFLIIGDLKAGSSSLHFYLHQHPEVFMPAELKELRYFAYDKENPYHVTADSSRVRTFDEYLKFFERSGNAKAVGETSPNYLRCPSTPAKIAEKLPDVKLIACLRNPADRLYSLYMMALRNQSVKKSFDERAFGENAAWIKGNFYWPDLKKYYDIFDSSQLKIILFDDLVTTTAEVTAGIYRFLEIDDSFTPDFAIQNPGGAPRSHAIYSLLVKSKRQLKKLGKRPPEFVRKAWAGIKKKSLHKQEINPQSRKKVLEVCRDDILRTQDLVQRDLSIWLE